MGDRSSDIDALLRELVENEPDGRDQQEAQRSVETDDPQQAPSEAMSRPAPVVDSAQPHLDESVGRSRAGLVAVGVVVLIVLAGLGGWLLGRGDGSTSASEETATEAESGLEATPTETEADTPAATVADDSTSVAEVSPSASEEPFVVPSTPDNPNGAVQYTVLSGGKSYLRGWYSSAEEVGIVVAESEALLGKDNVINEAHIDPRAPSMGVEYTVYLEDYILFESDSAELAPDFYPILDIGVVFLGRNPAMKEKVVARTDYRGSAAYNLELSEQRAQAVADYYLSRGVDPAQIILDPRGEEGASQGVDEDEAMQDRRVELIIISPPGAAGG